MHVGVARAVRGRVGGTFSGAVGMMMISATGMIFARVEMAAVGVV